LSCLCALLEPLDISPQAARLTLSRMRQKGYFFTRRQGRHSFYFLTAPGLAEITTTEGRSLLRGAPPAWDGRFHMVSYEVPEALREQRQNLTTLLRQAGLGRAAAGLWASAYPLPGRLAASLEASESAGLVTRYLAELQGDAAAFARRIWRLDEAVGRLEAFLTQYRSALAEYRAAGEKAAGEKAAAGRAGRSPAGHRGQPGRSGPAECFRRYFFLLGDFIPLMASLPPVPPGLLPANWPAAAAHELFLACRQAVHDGAEAYVDAVYVPFDDSGESAAEAAARANQEEIDEHEPEN